MPNYFFITLPFLCTYQLQIYCIILSVSCGICKTCRTLLNKFIQVFYPPMTGVRNNESSLLINHCPKSTSFLLFEYYMEKPVLEAITYIFNIPTNQKVPLIQQTVSVLSINIASRFKHKKILTKSNQINIMQLSFIALSLLFRLVSDSYKLSVKIVL